MFSQKSNHDRRRRAENNHLSPFQSDAARRIDFVDHPFLFSLLEGLLIGIDGDDMLYADAPQAAGERTAHEP